MKKLIVIISFVCNAAILNAAALNWSTVAMHADYSGLDNGTYWLVSLGADSGVSSSFYVRSDGSYNFGSYSIVDTGTIPSGSYGSVGGSISGLSEANNGMYYSLIVWDGNANGYYVAAGGEVSGIKDAPPSPANPISFGDGGVMYATTEVVPVGPEPTPEPTSGLLLVLGIAGLALKRKHT